MPCTRAARGRALLSCSRSAAYAPPPGRPRLQGQGRRPQRTGRGGQGSPPRPDLLGLAATDPIPRSVRRLPECGGAAPKRCLLPPGLRAWGHVRGLPHGRCLPIAVLSGGGGRWEGGNLALCRLPGSACRPRGLPTPRHAAGRSVYSFAAISAMSRHADPAACRRQGRNACTTSTRTARSTVMQQGVQMAVFQCAYRAGVGAGAASAHRSTHRRPPPAGRASLHPSGPPPIFSPDLPPPICALPPPAQARAAPAWTAALAVYTAAWPPARA